MTHWLTGNKTYLLAVCIGVLSAAHALGWITEDTFHTLVGLLGAGGLAALRAGVKRDTREGG